MDKSTDNAYTCNCGSVNSRSAKETPCKAAQDDESEVTPTGKG